MKNVAPLIAVCCAFIAVGVAQIDIRHNPVRYVPVPTDKVVVKERVVTKKVVVPAKKPDGYMTEQDCRTLDEGMSFSDLVFRFGWPAGKDGHDSYAGYMIYPLREDHDRNCLVDVWRGEVDGKSVDL
jgi:hypothetical protein